MAQQTKLPLEVPALIPLADQAAGVPAPPLPIHFLVNGPEKAAKDGPSIWAHIAHIGDMTCLPGSWL